MTQPADPAARGGEPDRLLEDSWSERGASLPRRMRRLETALTLVFSAVVGALLALAPGPVEAAPLTALVVVAYALAGQVQIPVGTGAVIPTQLFLVPLFGLASPQLVPALVVLGIALSLAADIVRGRFGRDRLLFAGGDAIHALGPALVLVAAGSPALTEASAFVLVAAFAAQLSLDYATSLVRVRIATGVRPQLQLRVQAHVWAVDAGLAPAGLLSLHALQSLPWAPLALLPLVGLAALTASDRTRRIERAHARLEALQRERHRLRLAVQRIGDAFASNLDLDALLQIVTRAAVEAGPAAGCCAAPR